MAETKTLDVLDFTGLVCSRLCHDLISPVGAIINGLEVLEDESDEKTKEFALDLIKKSARQASVRLQFCRLAFGAALSTGATIELREAETLARGFLGDDKTKLTWNLPSAAAPKNNVKLLLNLLMVAAQAIPRGGAITVDPAGGVSGGFRITAKGPNARVAQNVPVLLACQTVAGQAIDAHAIQPFYAGLLARTCTLNVGVATKDDTVVITAQ